MSQNDDVISEPLPLVSDFFDSSEEIGEWLDDIFCPEQDNPSSSVVDRTGDSPPEVRDDVLKTTSRSDVASIPNSAVSDSESVELPLDSWFLPDDPSSKESDQKKAAPRSLVNMGSFDRIVGHESASDDFNTKDAFVDAVPKELEQEQFHASVERSSLDEDSRSLACHDQRALSLAMERTRQSRKLVQAAVNKNQASERTKQSRKLVQAYANKDLRCKSVRKTASSLSKSQHDKLALARAMERSKQSRKIIQGSRSKGFVELTLDSVMSLTCRTRKMLQAVCYASTLKATMIS